MSIHEIGCIVGEAEASEGGPPLLTMKTYLPILFGLLIFIPHNIAKNKNKETKKTKTPTEGKIADLITKLTITMMR